MSELFLKRDASYFSHNMRSSLTREWDADLPCALLIGHNPSFGNGFMDDPSILRMITLTKAGGFGRFILMNIIPLVSPVPRDAWEWAKTKAADVWLQANRVAIRDQAQLASKIIVCFGAICQDVEFAIDLLEDIKGKHEHFWCWGTNADGSPRHPMARGRHRIPDNQELVIWSQT